MQAPGILLFPPSPHRCAWEELLHNQPLASQWVGQSGGGMRVLWSQRAGGWREGPSESLSMGPRPGAGV